MIIFKTTRSLTPMQREEIKDALQELEPYGPLIVLPYGIEVSAIDLTAKQKNAEQYIEVASLSGGPHNAYIKLDEGVSSDKVKALVESYREGLSWAKPFIVKPQADEQQVDACVDRILTGKPAELDKDAALLQKAKEQLL